MELQKAHSTGFDDWARHQDAHSKGQEHALLPKPRVQIKVWFQEHSILLRGQSQILLQSLHSQELGLRKSQQPGERTTRLSIQPCSGEDWEARAKSWGCHFFIWIPHDRQGLEKLQWHRYRRQAKIACWGAASEAWARVENQRLPQVARASRELQGHPKGCAKSQWTGGDCWRSRHSTGPKH